MSSAPADVPAATRVENAGLDVISESDRKGRPSDLFMPWFAANISVLGLSWGAWVLGFGLSFWQAVVAGSVGVIVSFLLCGVVAVLGKRGSAPTLALSRAAFGYNGNRLSAALSWILTVGWETVLCVSATLASATVFQALGWHNQVGAQILGFLLTVGLAASAGILGFEAIMRVQTWITWATAVLTIIYLVLVAPQISVDKILALPSGGPAAFIVRARVEGLRDLGSCLSPSNSFIFIQGLETLSLRIQHASQSALEIARWLQSQPEVAWVNYPGLESDQHHEICDRYLKGGFGCIITFGLKGGYEAAKSFVDNTEIFHIVANLGDTKSLIIHPSSTTHRQLSEEQQRSAGVTPDLVRLSIGLEAVEDLKADLAQALKKATK